MSDAVAVFHTFKRRVRLYLICKSIQFGSPPEAKGRGIKRQNKELDALQEDDIAADPG